MIEGDGAISGLTDIIMVGLVAIMGYYVLQSGVLTGTQQTAPAPVTYTTPAPATVPTLETQCTTESGVWQGNCCSCPNANCTNKCGANYAYDEEDACAEEDGIWQPNRSTPCCSCPNKECSRKCGSIKEDPSGGLPGTITKSASLEGVCQSEGPVSGKRPNLVYGNKWNGKCCTCPNRTCQNKCKSSAPAAPKKNPSGGNPAKKITQLVNPKKPTYKPAGQFVYRTNLAGSSSRRGPSYTGRDDFRHYTNVEFPTPIDFEYESVNRPNWLGPVSPERHALIRRFQSNFGSMRFSG